MKPEMWTDGKIVRLSDAANLLFIALLNQADDTGRLQNDPKEIECRAPRFWERSKELILELEKVGLVSVYGPARGFLQISNFTKHQVIDRPRPSDLPSPRARRTLSEQSTQGKERKGIGKEGNGKEGVSEIEIPETLKANEPEILEWLAYKKERGETYKPRGLQALFKKLEAIPSDQLKEAIQNSMANNWAGIFPKGVSNAGTPKGGAAGEPGKYAKIGT